MAEEKDMIDENMQDKDKVARIHEIYSSLSDSGKDEFAAHIAEDADLMSRLLSLLLRKNEEAEAEFGEKKCFVDFLRKVRGE